MAVDQQGMRRDLFDLIKVFGPANAGGPAQMNTNPGANPNPPPNIAQGRAEDPAPGPQAAAAAQGGPAPTQAPPTAPPSPVGVRQLPPNTPVKPNGGDYVVPGSAGVNQQPIELLPNDADPNLLPPEMRNSPLFRYLQAQRVGQYKEAQERSRFSNFAGALGNIASLATGGQAINQGGARAGTPEALGFQELHTLQDDASKQATAAKTEAALKQAEKDLTTIPGITPEMARIIIATKPEKAAELVEGRGSINDDEKERLRINTDLEAKGQRPYSPIEWHTMQTAEKIKVATAHGQGSPGKIFHEGLATDTRTAIDVADKSRDAMTPTQAALRTINDPNSKLWVGGFYGDPTVQGVAKYLSGIINADLSGITDAETLRSRVKTLYAGQLKAIFGGQPSDKEGQALDQMIGADGRLNRDALKVIMRENLARQVQSQLNAQEKIKQSGQVFGDDQRSMDFLASANERAAAIPDVTTELFGDPVVNGLVAARDNPEALASFDKRYGRGMAAYVLAKRGGQP